MNRIILIGNGFDKASDLKTSYEEFILWYFKSIFEGKLKGESLMEGNLYKDQLLSIERFKKSINISNKIKEVKDFEELRHLCSINISGFSKGQMYGGAPRVIIHSNFFKRLLEQKTWGEIESEYFKDLHDIKSSTYNNTSQSNSSNNRKKDILKLNKDFAFIKDVFSKYIKEVDEQI
ncbi:MAG: hypothetical protein WD530_04030 [Vicingaceae bacterium]